MFNSGKQRTGRQKFFRVAAFIAGIVFLVILGQEHLKESRIRSNGELATIEPIDGYTRRHRKGSTTYTAEITFETSKGRKVSQKHSIPKDAIDELERGGEVKVIYDPDSPSNFVFEKADSDWMPALVGGGFIVAAIFFL